MSDGGAAANLWAREARPRKRSRVGEAGGHQPLSLSIASARSARARTSKRWVPASFSFDSERAKRASPNQQTVGSKRMQQPECTSRYTPNRNRPLPAGRRLRGTRYDSIQVNRRLRGTRYDSIQVNCEWKKWSEKWKSDGFLVLWFFWNFYMF